MSEEENAPEEKKVYDDNNRGAIFKNNRKESPNHPDYSGSCTVDKVEYYINGWTKESKTGTKYLSFSFKPKKKREQTESTSVDTESFF